MDFFNKCLLCLLHNKNIKDISYEDIAIQDKIKYVFPDIIPCYNKIVMFVNYTPHTPKHICIDCFEDLNRVYKFKQKCLKSLNTLSDYVEEIEQSQQRAPFNTKNDSDHIVKLKNEIFEPFEVKNEILEAFDEHLEYKESRTAMIKTEVDRQRNSDNLEETYSSNYLEEVEVKGEPIEYHDETDLQGDPLFIGETYTEDILQNETSNSDAGANRLYKCTDCHKSFTRSHHLLRHKLVHTGARPFLCDVCNKAFNDQTHLRRHKRTHSGEKPYKCDVCNRAFNQLNNLTTHIRTHTGIKPYECEMCVYKSTTSSGLKLHVRRMHTKFINDVNIIE